MSAVSPVTASEMGWSVEPLPTETPAAGTRVPKVSLQVEMKLGEYRKKAVVAPRLGLTVPVKVAVVLPNVVTGAVTTTGGPGVTKVTGAPTEVPAVFEA